MDPAVISALSGAPASIVLAVILVLLLKDRRSSEESFLRALAEERKAIREISRAVRNQTAVLLAALEIFAPGRGAETQARAARLFTEGDAL